MLAHRLDKYSENCEVSFPYLSTPLGRKLSDSEIVKRLLEGAWYDGIE